MAVSEKVYICRLNESRDKPDHCYSIEEGNIHIYHIENKKYCIIKNTEQYKNFTKNNISIDLKFAKQFGKCYVDRNTVNRIKVQYFKSIENESTRKAIKIEYTHLIDFDPREVVSKFGHVIEFHGQVKEKRKFIAGETVEIGTRDVIFNKPNVEIFELLKDIHKNCASEIDEELWWWLNFVEQVENDKESSFSVKNEDNEEEYFRINEVTNTDINKNIQVIKAFENLQNHHLKKCDLPFKLLPWYKFKDVISIKTLAKDTGLPLNFLKKLFIDVKKNDHGYDPLFVYESEERFYRLSNAEKKLRNESYRKAVLTKLKKDYLFEGSVGIRVNWIYIPCDILLTLLNDIMFERLENALIKKEFTLQEICDHIGSQEHDKIKQLLNNEYERKTKNVNEAYDSNILKKYKFLEGFSESKKSKSKVMKKTIITKTWKCSREPSNKEVLTTFRNGKYTFNFDDITDDIVKDLLKIETICPVKFLQFLKMMRVNKEPEYNQLYQLSNCNCGKPSCRSKWRYVVGDDIQVNRFEVFDLLVFNAEEKQSYIFHFKKDFKTQSARDLCSQVRVSSKELLESLIYYRDDERHIIKKFQQTCTEKLNRDEKKAAKFKLASKAMEEYEIKNMKFHMCLAPCISLDEFFNGIDKEELISEILEDGVNGVFKRYNWEEDSYIGKHLFNDLHDFFQYTNRTILEHKVVFMD